MEWVFFEGGELLLIVAAVRTEVLVFLWMENCGDAANLRVFARIWILKK